jgi:hypothetical protein
MLVPAGNRPHMGRRFDATIVWMNEKPLEPHRPYLLKQTTNVTPARVREIQRRINVNTLDQEPAGRLSLNEIGLISVETQRPLFFDPYRRNRATGSFVLIDPISNDTLGAGMIAWGAEEARSHGRVTPEERQERNGHRPAMIWLENGSQAAYLLERRLFDHGCQVCVVPRGSESWAVMERLTAIGMIAIMTGADPGDLGPLRAEIIRLRKADLPEKPELAAAAAWGALCSHSIIDAAQEYTQGGGI